MSNYFLLTTDVETTSLVNHCLSDETGKLVAEQVIPRVLDFYDKYNVRSTFFITGYFASLYPSTVKELSSRGHEIGCHGLFHNHENAFDILNLKI